MRDFLKAIRDRVLIYDGSKGYMLQKMGMKGGECPELWNVEHSEEVKSVYKLYRDAGADVIQTNTFQGNRPRLEEYSLGNRVYELNYEGARLAREVMGKDGLVAASIGPIGKLFEPSGELTFENAYQIYREQVRAVVDGGVDAINFETFTDVAEMRAALLAAKDETSLPVICSIAFESNGRTLMGTDPYTAAVILKSLGADMVGTNCSLGSEHMLKIVGKMSEAGGLYLSVKPNAGLPEMINGEILYRESAEGFAQSAREFVKFGARLIGGCCGTTPEFTKKIAQGLKGMEPFKVQGRYEKVITSGVKLLNLENTINLSIGQLNVFADDELKDALGRNNTDFAADRALEMSTEGFEAVYVNVDGVSDDMYLLRKVVNDAQAYIKAPLIIETDNPASLNNALRIYKGKAGVVIKGLKQENIEELLAVAKKYGSTIVEKDIIKG